MKKLALLITTSCIALGTSAIGLQTDLEKEKRSVVVVAVTEDVKVDNVASDSVVKWRK